MSAKKQVFHSTSRLRWRIFQCIIGFIAILILSIPVALYYGFYNKIIPDLPLLLNTEEKTTVLKNPARVGNLSTREKSLYRGFDSFLTEKAKNHSYRLHEKTLSEQKANVPQMRAAFFVDWDPQSLYSLQNYIKNITVLIPNWVSIDPQTYRLVSQIDPKIVALVREHKVQIFPLLSNMVNGDFDPKLLSSLL
jgi:peptidoglycan-N-acetylglucosamine deacetylase